MWYQEGGPDAIERCSDAVEGLDEEPGGNAEEEAEQVIQDKLAAQFMTPQR